jgi:glycosyltransferase involved in cell wall biosynthesis
MPRPQAAARRAEQLRIAWLGPAPRDTGGVAGVGFEVIRGLLELGHAVDCYVGRLGGPVPAELGQQPGLRVFTGESGWKPDAWYSRGDLTTFITGQSTRALAMRKLVERLQANHAAARYDVLYQFSHIEVLGLSRHLHGLPPLVVHPETHAAGELRWFRREQRLARQCEPLGRRLAVRGMLSARAAVQRRHASLAAGFICPSRAFRRWLVEDYGIAVDRTRIVPNPINLDRFRPAAGRRGSGEPLRAVFVGRISVRKGVESLVELSHRLGDLAGSLRIDVIGNRTLWSDYRPLLDDLDPRIATYRGGVPPAGMAAELASADLLIQPSRYEPFGLTVGEALASGVPVVVTDEVGAAEDVSGECARVAPAGDVAALEREVRELVAELRSGEGPRLSSLARAEAERLFEPDAVARRVAQALEELAA